MKSLHDHPFTHKSPEIFTPEILQWIIAEGFEQGKDDSYCNKLTNNPYEETAFVKVCGENSNYHICVYIFSYGIGVDIDYDCGGNLYTIMFEFKSYSFEEAYDEMVDYVNKYKF